MEDTTEDHASFAHLTATFLSGGHGGTLPQGRSPVRPPRSHSDVGLDSEGLADPSGSLPLTMADGRQHRKHRQEGPLNCQEASGCLAFRSDPPTRASQKLESLLYSPARGPAWHLPW